MSLNINIQLSYEISIFFIIQDLKKGCLLEGRMYQVFSLSSQDQRTPCYGLQATKGLASHY